MSKYDGLGRKHLRRQLDQKRAAKKRKFGAPFDLVPTEGTNKRHDNPKTQVEWTQFILPLKEKSSEYSVTHLFDGLLTATLQKNRYIVEKLCVIHFATSTLFNGVRNRPAR